MSKFLNEPSTNTATIFVGFAYQLEIGAIVLCGIMAHKKSGGFISPTSIIPTREYHKKKVPVEAKTSIAQKSWEYHLQQSSRHNRKLRLNSKRRRKDKHNAKTNLRVKNMNSGLECEFSGVRGEVIIDHNQIRFFQQRQRNSRTPILTTTIPLIGESSRATLGQYGLVIAVTIYERTHHFSFDDEESAERFRLRVSTNISVLESPSSSDDNEVGEMSSAESTSSEEKNDNIAGASAPQTCDSGESGDSGDSTSDSGDSKCDSGDSTSPDSTKIPFAFNSIPLKPSVESQSSSMSNRNSPLNRKHENASDAENIAPKIRRME